MKTHWLKEKTLDTHHLKAIQETIGRFLNDQVLTPGGEFYYDPNENMEAKAKIMKTEFHIDPKNM